MDYAHYGPWAFLAGGSEGVGASFARKLAAQGINLVISARKPEPIQALAAELRRDFGVQVREVPLNLVKPGMLDTVKTATDDIEIGMLIYNAGGETSLTPFLDRKPGRAEMMIALNAIAPTQLTFHFAQGMRERRRGGIIIVGSNSGHTGVPGQIVYSAAKSYEFTFAEGLWSELKAYDVHVLGLIIGLTRTPNIERMGFTLEGHEPAECDDVAQEGLDHIGRGDPIRVIGGWTEKWARLRSLPRAEAMGIIERSEHR